MLMVIHFQDKNKVHFKSTTFGVQRTDRIKGTIKDNRVTQPCRGNVRENGRRNFRTGTDYLSTKMEFLSFESGCSTPVNKILLLMTIDLCIL
jgi:hypothetical protein